MLLLPDGGHYIGEFNADSRPHGEGVEFRADGTETASGQWREGQLHGRGRIIHANGDRYEGEVVAGQASGLGSFTWADGREYVGELSDNIFEGFGFMSSRGPCQYVVHCGRWKDGILAESRPVLFSKLVYGSMLSAAGQHSHCVGCTC